MMFVMYWFWVYTSVMGTRDLESDEAVCVECHLSTHDRPQVGIGMHFTNSFYNFGSIEFRRVFGVALSLMRHACYPYA